MKKKYSLPLILMIGLFAALITTLMLVGYKNAMAVSRQQTGIITPANAPDYHFAMICPNIDDPFWVSIKKGVEKASREFNVAVEFNGPRSSDAQEELKYLNIAIASKVDGIAAHISDEAGATTLIDKAVSHNIPVVTVQSDARNSRRSSYIGSNIYDLGLQLGKMLMVTASEQASALVLIGDSQNSSTETQSLILSGIKDSIQKDPRIRIRTMSTTDNEFLGSEEEIRGMLEKYPEIDTIICTTEQDTIGVAQLLVDLNKVGYNVIGYGESPSVLRYIQNGVIYGSVTGNPEKMGYDAIKALVDLKQSGRTSAYFPVELQQITKGNVSAYAAPDQE